MNENKYKDFVNFLFNRNLINLKIKELLQKETTFKGRATILFEKLVKLRIDDIEEICEYLHFTVIGNDVNEISKKILKRVLEELEENIQEESNLKTITISKFLEKYKEQLGKYQFQKDNYKKSLTSCLKDLSISEFKKILRDFNLDFVGYFLRPNELEEKINDLFEYIDFDDDAKKKADELKRIEEEKKKQEELKRQEENKRKYEELKKLEEEKAKADKLRKEAEEQKRKEEESKKKADEEIKKQQELKLQQEHQKLSGGNMNIKEYQEKLNKGEFTSFKEDNNIKTKAEMYIYKGIDVTHKDNYTISTDLKIKPYAYLVNGDKNVCGLFELKQYNKKNNEYFLIV
mgnify:CR=1 FL=1